MLKFLLPLGALAAYALYNKGAGAKKLDYEVVGVRVHKFTLPATVDLRIAVRFLNPSSQSFKVNSVRLNIKQAGTLLGDCYANLAFAIAPGSQPVQEFPVNVRGLAVLQKLVPLLLANKPLPILDISGFLTVEGIEAPLSDIQVPLAAYDPRKTAAATTPPKPAAKAPAAPAKPAPTTKPAAKTPAKPAAPKKKAAAPAKKKAAPAKKKYATSAPRR
ncbi:hypothetical protein Q5H93_02940 [Hymenobacter sp. ASUV-10]|uniref:Late embryogenesis abundant protein LEA-2 subgroup domain-containing protein n=1 Tax=Hymenobacter aranciens TaxID=3063996 RepID=A0ABT9B5Y3_9BACT|nr:hypothetical protein [Hymenobacter sp. ASUV-10]MDO7873675.1 hypothetical protein [Hymenobacter sp. ASUV-10]